MVYSNHTFIVRFFFYTNASLDIKLNALNA